MRKQLSSIEELAFLKDYYTIDIEGNIFSSYGGSIRELTHSMDRYGYKKIGLQNKEGGNSTLQIHRLIALAFIPRVQGKDVVNHINEITTDNNISNLEWCTHKENANHGTRNARMIDTLNQKVHSTIIATVIETGEEECYHGVKDLKDSGFDQSAVSRCANGIRQSHKGRTWKYK